jgi:hypothetical protein
MDWAASIPVQAKKGADQLKCANLSTPRLIGESGNNACVGGISDALAMAGLNVSSAKGAQSSQEGGPTPSPVDAARSIALENAMRRANQGFSRFDFTTTARSYVDPNTSLFESEAGGSASLGSESLEESKSGKEPTTVDEPPQLVRKDLPGALEQTDPKPPGMYFKLLERASNPVFSQNLTPHFLLLACFRKSNRFPKDSNVTEHVHVSIKQQTELGPRRIQGRFEIPNITHHPRF